MRTELLHQAWKQSDEYLLYHPQASHVNPDHRDGWNACYKATKSVNEERLLIFKAIGDAGLILIKTHLGFELIKKELVIAQPKP